MKALPLKLRLRKLDFWIQRHQISLGGTFQIFISSSSLKIRDCFINHFSGKILEWDTEAVSRCYTNDLFTWSLLFDDHISNCLLIMKLTCLVTSLLESCDKCDRLA